MKFFTAIKLATFAESSFKAAGLDLEKLAAAGDVDAIKTALAAKAAPDAEQEKILAAAIEENKELAAKLATAQAAQAKAEAKAKLISTVTGIAAEGEASEGEVKAAHELAIAKQARLFMAKAGHPGVADELPAEPTKAKDKAKPETATATGRDRMAKAFGNEIRRQQQRERDDRN